MTNEAAEITHRCSAAQRDVRVLARVFRARMPYTMMAFLAGAAAAAVPELSVHPERAGSYIVVYAMQAQIWLLALTLTRNAPLSYPRAVAIAMGTTVSMFITTTAYHWYSGADPVALSFALAYVTAGALLLFPWPGVQLYTTASSAVAYAWRRAA